MAEGHCEDRFADVREEFERNFAERGEVGASVCVTVDGETVVDLWGGSTSVAGEPWATDTLCVVMSCTKGATALCAHLLASAGELDFDATVASYWPDFAAAGKEVVLVRHLLNHQAGLPALREPLKDGAFYDWEYMTARLAAEEPFWEPGTRYGYHALTYGFLVGEVVRRVTGNDIGTFFNREVAAPLGLDATMGLPVSEHHRVATFYAAPPPPDLSGPFSKFAVLTVTDPDSIPARVMTNTGGYLAPGEWDSPRALEAVLPSTGIAANARSLAGMYRAIVTDGRIGRFQLDDDDIARMGSIQSAVGEDQVLYGPGRWTFGFHTGVATPKGVEPPGRVILGPSAFGHTGFGGSIGFADPDAGLSFAYVMNQMCGDVGLAETGQSLVDATYRALGFHLSKYDDIWVPSRS